MLCPWIDGRGSFGPSKCQDRGHHISLITYCRSESSWSKLTLAIDMMFLDLRCNWRCACASLAKTKMNPNSLSSGVGRVKGRFESRQPSKTIENHPSSHSYHQKVQPQNLPPSKKNLPP